MESGDHELADRDHAAFGVERLDPQVRIDSLDLRSVECAVRIRGDAAELDAFAVQLHGHGMLELLSPRYGEVACGAEVGGDLIREHFFQAEAEKMRSVAAVGTGINVTAGTSRPARTAVASCATVRKSGADGVVGVDVADAVGGRRTLSLEVGEFALEELAPPTHRAEGVARDQVKG